MIVEKMHEHKFGLAWWGEGHYDGDEDSDSGNRMWMWTVVVGMGTKLWG